MIVIIAQTVGNCSKMRKERSGLIGTVPRKHRPFQLRRYKAEFNLERAETLRRLEDDSNWSWVQLIIYVHFKATAPLITH